jgi:DNA-binding PadR family transcriptional regulator
MDRIGSRRRRTRRIGIPKGMLRHITLDILKRIPMSGIELMDEIEYYSDWKPSPGSVYPLLSKLEEQGLIEFVESDDPYLKRYALTKTGIKVIEERRKLGPNIRSHFHSIQKIHWKFFEGMDENLFENYSMLLKAIEKIHPLIKNNPEASSRVQKLILEASKEIDKIYRQLEKQK